ncbi:MAG: hypothetical protein RLZ77_3 [Bacteroidota bacterium]|jgi:hypothetical protein
MKKGIFYLILITLLVSNSNAQNYCGASFEAYSVKIIAHCKYCNMSSRYTIIPKKIKFNRPLVCETLNDPTNASSEGKCKFNSIVLHINFKYYLNLMQMLAFYSEKCESINNPKNKHESYIDDPVDVGLQDYSFEESEVSNYYEAIEYTKSTIGSETYDQCRAQAATYALGCIRESCD